MASRRALERRLDDLAGFAHPRAALEQYPTPPDIAAHLCHLADLHDDLEGTVVDLGTGTGILALAAATRAPQRVVGVERDPDALAVARENERALEAITGVDWLVGDATRAPLCLTDATVLSNPPFGAQDGNEHADRAFLATAASLATVSYTIHNAGSRAFVESYAADNGGTVTHAFAVSFDVDRQFAHHTDERRTIDAEAYRIEWR
jgi:putative methylase